MLTKRNKICIVGSGGFAREVFQIIKQNLEIKNIDPFGTCFFLVKDDEFSNQIIYGIETLPESKFDPEIYELVLSVAAPLLRKKLNSKFPKATIYPNIISQHAIISEYISFGVGTIVCPGSVLTCDIEIGDHAHINLNSSIGHDCKIGDFFTCSPGVNVSGNCTILNQVYFGTSAIIKQGLKICDNTIVGMGGVVVNDIEQSGTYVGNPIRKIK